MLLINRKWNIPNWFYWTVGMISVYCIILIMLSNGGAIRDKLLIDVGRLESSQNALHRFKSIQLMKNKPREMPVKRSNAIQHNSKYTAANTITTKLAGKIGNHMFQYASIFCLGRKYKRRVVYNSTLLWSLFPYMTAQKELPDGYGSEASYSSTNGGNFGDCKFSEIRNFLHTKAKQHFLLNGYLQSWCYFKDCESEIRNEFRIHEELVVARDNFLLSKAKIAFSSHVKPSNMTYVAVHIRRGNFIAAGRVVAPASYFEHAVHYMENLTSHVQSKMYIVASNDLSWAREIFKAPNPIVFADQETKGFPKANFDFAILAGCNHTIMSVGTFSWWAAYMAGGKAVYYKMSPGGKSWEKKQAHYLPRWVGIE